MTACRQVRSSLLQWQDQERGTGRPDNRHSGSLQVPAKADGLHAHNQIVSNRRQCGKMIPP
jgi:hypothetical protein